MKTTTLENKEVISIINKKVIPTELDAERTDDIMFHGKSFAYNEKAKTHELALALGSDEKGKMQYPTIVIVNNKNEILFQYQGAMNAEELIAVFSKL
jgi:thioredoxin-related protein